MFILSHNHRSRSPICVQKAKPCLFRRHCKTMSHLPETTGTKFANANDLEILHSSKYLEEVKATLSRDVTYMNCYCQQCHLCLNVSKSVCSAFHFQNRSTDRQREVKRHNNRLPFTKSPTYLGMQMGQSVTFNQHAEKVAGKTAARVILSSRRADHDWGADCTI